MGKNAQDIGGASQRSTSFRGHHYFDFQINESLWDNNIDQ